MLDGRLVIILSTKIIVLVKLALENAGQGVTREPPVGMRMTVVGGVLTIANIREQLSVLPASFGPAAHIVNCRGFVVSVRLSRADYRLLVSITVELIMLITRLLLTPLITIAALGKLALEMKGPQSVSLFTAGCETKVNGSIGAYAGNVRLLRVMVTAVLCGLPE